MRTACLVYLILVGLYTLSMNDGWASEGWASPPVEIRGVWMDRNSIPKTEQGIRKLVRDYAGAGINIIFPEVVFNGYSAYPSSYLTEMNLWGGVQALDILIDEAHKQGIEVHPWVWVFRVGNANDKGGILTRHPEWAALGKDGKPISDGRGYWLCPSNPAVRHLLIRAITELAQKYAVDGIHLDYIRFDYEDPVPKCYDQGCRQKFEAEYGVDPQAIEPWTKSWLEWHMWREELINTFVRDVSKALRAIRPEIKISAAVVPDPQDSRLSVLQNWLHWAANGWVDFIAPMSYTSSTQDFESTVAKAAEQTGVLTFLAPGIGLLYLPKDPARMLEQVSASRRLPVAGVTLFASAYLDKQHLDALAAGPFRRRASLPFRSPETQAKKLLSHAQHLLSAADSPDQLDQASREVAYAKHIMDYLVYRRNLKEEVKPSPPNVFIPDVVIPIPEAKVPTISTPPTIDGSLEDEAWNAAAKVEIEYTALGREVTQPTCVMLACDADNLYIAFRCTEPRANAIRVSTHDHDGAVFQDDSVEVFLEINEKSYAHLAVNAGGATYDAKNYDVGWNPGWQAAVGLTAGAWVAEIAFPLVNLGRLPSAGTVLHANFCRNRVLVYQEAENMAWSPTYGSYHTPKRFGRLLFLGQRQMGPSMP